MKNKKSDRPEMEETEMRNRIERLENRARRARVLSFRRGKSGLKGTLSERRRSSSSGLLSLGVIDFPAHESNFLEEASVARFSSAYYHVKSINSPVVDSTPLRSQCARPNRTVRRALLYSLATFRK